MKWINSSFDPIGEEDKKNLNEKVEKNEKEEGTGKENETKEKERE